MSEEPSALLQGAASGNLASSSRFPGRRRFVPRRWRLVEFYERDWAPPGTRGASIAAGPPARDEPGDCVCEGAVVYTAYPHAVAEHAAEGQVETFDYESLSIRYVRSGSGVPVVFLHNGGTSHAIWDDVTPLLDGFELYAIDLLGFGASTKPERGYELETHVAILGAFIDAVVREPVHLVGNCMGSATSLAFAMQCPSAVRAMVLINTLTAATFAKGIYGAMLGLPQRAPALVSIMSKFALGARLGRLGVRSQLGRCGIERRIHERTELCACYAGASQSRALLEVLADIPSYAVLDRFEPPPGFPPICTIWGLENRVLRAEQGRTLVSTLHPARQEWLEGCGHLPMLERPERVAAILREFLGSAYGQERSGK